MQQIQEDRRVEEKKEILLKEKQELERKVKLLELELQQEKERSHIREEIVKSQSRIPLIKELEDEDADSQNFDEEIADDGILDKQGGGNEDARLCGVDVGSITRKNPIVQNIGEVLLELQKPKLKIKMFDGDCLSFTKFIRQLESRKENVCNDDEKMANLKGVN